MDGTASPPHVRRRSVAWILWSVVGICVCSTIALVLWLFLPRWSPGIVVRWSPWVDPALRAVVDGGLRGSAFFERVRAWGRDYLPACAVALRDPRWEVRHAAVVALRTLDEEVRDDLVIFLPTALADRDHRVQAAAIDVAAGLWGKIEGRRSRLPDLLVPLLADQSEVTRAAVVAALAGHARYRPLDDDEIAVIAARFADPRPAVRTSVIAALAIEHRPSSTAALAHAATDPDAGVRRAAVLALCSIEDDHVVHHLARLLAAGPDPEVRTMLVQAMEEWEERRPPVDAKPRPE